MMLDSVFAIGLLLVLVVVGMTVPFLMILHAWIVEESLNTGLALAALGALLIFPFVIWQTQGTIWMFLGVAGMVAGCAALPYLSAQRDKCLLNRLREEDIAKYRRAIEFDPKNAAAHAFLADAYMESGLYDEAIEAYQKAIELDPHHTRPERWKLQKAIDAKQGKTRPRLLVCDACQGETPHGNRVCAHCGATLRMGFLEWLAQPETLKSVTRQTVIALLALTILYTAFSALPLEWKGGVIGAVAIGGGYYLLKGMRGH
ncbi:MAG: tetratricopeptide repeat protein [Abditibacteriales bacterium]|nr:tetratricopeptide repeat protein [Abditibacteriales bacterium]MDW8367109.1 tetratricopeptide repeat protein [Abditibacteriales bacterium]